MLAASSPGEFFRRAVVVAALALALLVLWRIHEVLLLAFASILLATLLRAIGDPIRRRTGLPGAVAYGVAIVLVVALFAAAGWIFGTQVSAQANALADRLPGAIASLRSWMQDQAWARPMLENFDPSGSASTVAARLGGFAMTGFDVAVGVIVILFGALYFGAQPGLYRRGLILLFPPRLHERAGKAFDLAAYAMRRWLIGQLVDMALVGTLSGLGLWALGAPSPLALGLLSGVASFVPYVGPIAAGALAVLVAAAQSLELGLWTLALYVGIQQVEGHLIMPFVQRWTIALPPALGVFAVVAVGSLFGPLGVLLATPLTVVAFVLVKKLYLKDTLGEPVPIER